jgi:hypothetical protein
MSPAAVPSTDPPTMRTTARDDPPKAKIDTHGKEIKEENVRKYKRRKKVKGEQENKRGKINKKRRNDRKEREKERKDE